MKETKFSLGPWIPVILWMAIIFLFSAQSATASAGLSQKLIRMFMGFIDQLIPAFGSGGVDSSQLDHLVRKLAHFSLYMVLGFLAVRALRKTGITGWKLITAAILICVVYAATDELHQVLVPGRSGQISDVFIDSLGGMMGAFLSAPACREEGSPRH